MKNIVLSIFTLVMAALLSGCQEGDGFSDIGDAVIYIPQATTSGGLNNHYAVPSGGGKDTYNFRVEEGKVKVILSVTRSGAYSGKAFSVTAMPMVDETQNAIAELISSGDMTNAELLPTGSYSFPSQVSVPAGSSDTSFYVNIDIATLREARYDGKKLLLQIGISNPTAYRLSDTNTTVMVVVDVDAIRGKL